MDMICVFGHNQAGVFFLFTDQGHKFRTNGRDLVINYPKVDPWLAKARARQIYYEGGTVKLVLMPDEDTTVPICLGICMNDANIFAWVTEVNQLFQKTM